VCAFEVIVKKVLSRSPAVQSFCFKTKAFRPEKPNVFSLVIPSKAVAFDVYDIFKLFFVIRENYSAL